MLNANEVDVAVTGAIYSMKAGDTIPTGPTGGLSTATDHGFATDDGIEITADRTTQNITAWQDASTVRVLVTESSITYHFTLLQNNQANRELYFGAEEVDGKIQWNPANSGGRKPFVIDALDRANRKVIRHVIPSGEVTELGAQNLQNGGAIQYEITITAFNVDGRCVDIYNAAAPTTPEA